MLLFPTVTTLSELPMAEAVPISEVLPTPAPSEVVLTPDDVLLLAASVLMPSAPMGWRPVCWLMLELVNWPSTTVRLPLASRSEVLTGTFSSPCVIP